MFLNTDNQKAIQNIFRRLDQLEKGIRLDIRLLPIIFIQNSRKQKKTTL